jgi:glucose/arabinose dehydrogenase
MRFSLALAASVIALGLPALAAAPAFAQVETKPPEVPTEKPAFPGQTRAPTVKTQTAYELTTLATGLNHPWGMAISPRGSILVTERAGRMRVISPDGKLSDPISGVPEVVASPGGGPGSSQGGLFDVVFSPGFATDRTIFFSYFAKTPADGLLRLTVARAKLSPDNKALSELKVIFAAEPGYDKQLNIGGRLAFARDKTLFISVGDRFQLMDKAQSLDNDLGKIVRINADGSIPKDNPFVGKAGARPEIWSYGVRNTEGLTLNPADGRIWEVEHGPRGGDEINRPDAAKNYGWPVITYGEDYNGKPIKEGITAQAGLEQPLYYWDPVIAPSGLVAYSGKMFPEWKGNLLIGSLKQMHVARVVLNGTKVVGEERLFPEIGARIRDVVEGPDGALYLSTDEEAGKVIKVTPKK